MATFCITSAFKLAASRERCSMPSQVRRNGRIAALKHRQRSVRSPCTSLFAVANRICIWSDGWKTPRFGKMKKGDLFATYIIKHAESIPKNGSFHNVFVGGIDPQKPPLNDIAQIQEDITRRTVENIRRGAVGYLLCRREITYTDSWISFA